MTLAFAILFLFLLGYAAVACAAVWHLNTYSFTRSAKLVSGAFIILSLILGALSVSFFSQIDWQELNKIPKIQETSYEI